MITGTQVRMARAAAKLGVRDVAAAAKVSPATLTRVESGQPANASTLSAIRTALEAVGVEFLEQNGIVFHGSSNAEMEAAGVEITNVNVSVIRLKPLIIGLSDEILLNGRRTSIQAEFDAGRGTSFRLVSKTIAGDQPDQNYATVWSKEGKTVTLNISQESFNKLRELGVRAL